MTVYSYARLGVGRGAVVLRPGKDGVLEAQFFVPSEAEAQEIVRYANSAMKHSLETEISIKTGKPIRIGVVCQPSPVKHPGERDAR